MTTFLADGTSLNPTSNALPLMPAMSGTLSGADGHTAESQIVQLPSGATVITTCTVIPPPFAINPSPEDQSHSAALSQASGSTDECLG